MSTQFYLLLAFFVMIVHSTPSLPTQEEYSAELKASGMSQSGIDGLAALSKKFTDGYTIVANNKPLADKFIADYTVDAQNYVASMSADDQKIYQESLKKYGLV